MDTATVEQSGHHLPAVDHHNASKTSTCFVTARVLLRYFDLTSRQCRLPRNQPYDRNPGVFALITRGSLSGFPHPYCSTLNHSYGKSRGFKHEHANNSIKRVE